jgi:hypothetical protein
MIFMILTEYSSSRSSMSPLVLPLFPFNPADWTFDVGCSIFSLFRPGGISYEVPEEGALQRLKAQNSKR